MTIDTETKEPVLRTGEKLSLELEITTNNIEPEGTENPLFTADERAIYNDHVRLYLNEDRPDTAPDIPWWKDGRAQDWIV